MACENSSVIIDGCFFRSPNKDNHRHVVKLYEKTFVFEEREGKQTIVSIDDVIGCHVMKVGGDGRPLAKNSAFFCIYAYHLIAKRGTALKSPGSFRQRHRYIFEVDIYSSYEQNTDVARKWQSAVLWLLNGHKFELNSAGDVYIPESLPAQRRYLCLVNPKSGPGKSQEIFEERVKPVLSEADISGELFVTKHPNHAREVARTLELDHWNAILIISGDGLLHEVYNGLMEREDKRKAVEIPIGIIPGGSGNALARSVSHATGEPYLADPILACTLGCVKGRIIPIDLMEIEIPRSPPIYSFLSVGWGIISDIDIESEKLRAIGEIRFTLWGLWRTLNLRTYSGRVSYIPAEVSRRPSLQATEARNTSGPSDAALGPGEGAASSEALNVPTSLRVSETFTGGTGLGVLASSNPGNSRGDGRFAKEYRSLRSQSVHATKTKELEEVGLPEIVGDDFMDRINTSTKSYDVTTEAPVLPSKGTVSVNNSESSTSAESNISMADSTLPKEDHNIILESSSDYPSIDDKVPDDWVVEEGRFIIVYASLQSHVNTKQLIAPQAKLNDGICWLQLIKGDATRKQVLTYFIKQDFGTHVDLPWVRSIPVKAFRIESFDKCIITVDGETVQTETLQARVLPAKARVFSV